MNEMIQVTKSSMPEFTDYVNEIQGLWDNRILTNMGEKHKLLELQLIDYLEVDNLTLFTNGHLALEYIIDAFDLKGEVITTPFTFASTTHAIVRNGLTPVFCDIDPEDFTLDVKKIEDLITERTSAIIPVHVYGKICDVVSIQRIAKKYNLKVIYDAAHAFGVTLNGEGIGKFGDASMFSFHATKVFNTIEGGAVTYNDSTLNQTLNHRKNFGISSQDSVDYPGGNAKMNEFQAAMGICNLRNVDTEIAKRKNIFERYVHHLKEIDGVKIAAEQPGIKSNYAYFPIVIDGYKLSRDQLTERLKENGIMARKYFYPLTNEFECYQFLDRKEVTPIAKYISHRVMTLPLYADLALDDVDRICHIIKESGV